MTGDGVSDSGGAADDRTPVPPVTTERSARSPGADFGAAEPAAPFFASDADEVAAPEPGPRSSAAGAAPVSPAEAGAGGAEAGAAPLDLGEVAEIVEEGPTGPAAAGGPAAEASDATTLAARLEALAARIRRDGEAALNDAIANGDRLDGLLAAVLAGYRAGR